MATRGFLVKPYYEHGGITIYHGDCREMLAQMVGAAIYGFWCDMVGGHDFPGRAQIEEAVARDIVAQQRAIDARTRLDRFCKRCDNLLTVTPVGLACEFCLKLGRWTR